MSRGRRAGKGERRAGGGRHALHKTTSDEHDERLHVADETGQTSQSSETSQTGETSQAAGDLAGEVAEGVKDPAGKVRKLFGK